MKCTCFVCTGQTPIYSYEIVRRGQAAYLQGGSECPHCHKTAAISMKGPSTPIEKFHTCTCLECGGTWLARLVEKVEVKSL